MKKQYQNLQEFKLPKQFRGRSNLTVQLWWLVQALLFQTSPQIMYGWRRALLRLFGAKIGKGVIIRPSVTVTYPWKLTIGEYSWIGDDVHLYSLGQIKIGDNVVISQKSYLCTGSHDYKSINFDIFAKEIEIKDQVWLASDVFVHPGITIDQGAVVAARSTVTTNLSEGMIYQGNPAKAVRPRY